MEHPTWQATLRHVKPLPGGCTLVEELHIEYACPARKADHVARAAARTIGAERRRRFYVAAGPVPRVEA